MQLTPAERQYYARLFSEADQDRDNVIAAGDALFLKKSGLDDRLLAEIWKLADNPAKGYLTAEEFNVTLKLIGYAQQQKKDGVNNPIISPKILAFTTPPPIFMGIPTMEVIIVFSSGLIKNILLTHSFSFLQQAAVPVDNTVWRMTAGEKEKFDEIFARADTDKDGYITGK